MLACHVTLESTRRKSRLWSANFSEKDAADITSWAQDLMRQGKTTPQRIQQLMAKAPTTAAAVSTSEEPES